jgi:nucleoside-diphosphate kinase
VERTLTIIKPDAVQAGHIGDVIKMLETGGLRIVAARMISLTQREAEGFYAVHQTKPFFESLTRFMSSGPALAMALEGEKAIVRLRELMGATDPAKAAPGTIRRLYAQSIERNAIHGSDSPETAASEIAYFFPGVELA